MSKRMKRKLQYTVLPIVAVVFIVVCLAWAGNSDYESEVGYIDRNGIVYTTENNEQHIVTTDGNVWVVYDTELENGTEVRVTFDGKKTADVTDDEIVEIRKRLF